MKVIFTIASSLLLTTACADTPPSAAKSDATPNSVVLRPGKIHEDCHALKAGTVTNWQFAATAPLDFNIHYHVGKDVFYPLERGAVQEAGGRFAAPSAQEYCWMWTNHGTRDVVLRTKLTPERDDK
jgi:hypothetical protein